MTGEGARDGGVVGFSEVDAKSSCSSASAIRLRRSLLCVGAVGKVKSMEFDEVNSELLKNLVCFVGRLDLLGGEYGGGVILTVFFKRLVCYFKLKLPPSRWAPE